MGIYQNNPCKECDSRNVGCHATCEQHKAWKEKVNAGKEKIYGENKTRIALDELDRKRSARIASYSRKRGAK